MKMALLCFFILALWVMGTSEDQSMLENHNESAVAASPEKLSDVQTQAITERIQFWSTSFKKSAVLEAVEHEIKNWTNIENELSFRIQNKKEENVDYVALYRSDYDWDIRGKTTEDEAFVLTNDDDRVVLEYDQYEVELSNKEFHLLWPIQHLTQLKQILELENYEHMIWQKKGKGWEVHILTSANLLLHSFHQYVLDFTENDQTVIEHTDSGRYFVTYRFQFKADDEPHRIHSFDVQLQKEGTLLEHVQFKF